MYITFIFTLGILYVIPIVSIVIKPILLVYSLLCYLIIINSIYFSERRLDKFNLKNVITNIKKNLYLYLLMWLTSIAIRIFFISFIGITNNIYSIDLFAYILFISYVLVIFIFLLVVHLYKGKHLNISMFISIFTSLKKNCSYQNIITLVFAVNLSLIIKHLFFELILNTNFKGYNVLNCNSDSEIDADHESISSNEYSNIPGGSGNRGPNTDIPMTDINDRESDDSDDLTYEVGHDLGCDETRVRYDNIDDIPSKKWGGGFWDKATTWQGWPENKIGTVSPNVEEGTPFKNTKRLILLGPNYDPINKTVGNMVLVDSINHGFLAITQAKAKTTLSLWEINHNLLNDTPINISAEYHKAYFDNTMVMSMLSWSRLGKGEFPYYKAYDALLKHYFPDKLGFSVQSQNKESTGIWDFSVRILDPRTPKVTKSIMGIEAKGADVGVDLFHQLHTLVEIKKTRRK